MTPQETEPDLFANVGGPPVEAWVGSDSPQGWGLGRSSPLKPWPKSSWSSPLTLP